MTQTLTALERELLGYVEQLVKASQHSATKLYDLEQRSTAMLEQQLSALTDFASTLAQSQIALANCLNALINESENYATANAQLQTSLNQLKHAEQRFNSGLRR